MALPGKKSHELWLCKVNVYPTGTLIDWEVDEHRDQETLGRLYERVEQQYQPRLVCTDAWKAYLSVIPKDRHVTGKAGTYTAEQDNSETRHWFARFRRECKVVSKRKDRISQALRLHAFRHWIWQHTRDIYLPVFG